MVFRTHASALLLLFLSACLLIPPGNAADEPVLLPSPDGDEALLSLPGYDAILASDPGNLTAFTGKMRLLASRGEWEEVAGRISGTEGFLDENPDGAALMAEAYAETGRYEDAIRILDEHPEIANLTVTRIRAASLLGLGRPRDAAALLVPVADDPAADPRLSLLTGRALSAGGNNTAAIPYLEAAYASLSSDPVAAVSLGSALSAEGLSEEALVLAREAVRRNPADADSWVMVAYLANRVESYDEALDALDEAITRRSGDPGLLNARAYTLYLAGRHEEGRKVIEEALMSNPSDPAALDTMGVILLADGDPGAALHYLEQAARGLSHNPEVLAHLGDAYRLTGREREAQDLYQRALLLDSTSGRAWLGYSGILISLGRYPEAAAAIAEAYRYYPGDPDLVASEREVDAVLIDWYLKGQNGTGDHP